MLIRPCPVCGKEIPPEADACPDCLPAPDQKWDLPMRQTPGRVAGEMASRPPPQPQPARTRSMQPPAPAVGSPAHSSAGEAGFCPHCGKPLSPGIHWPTAIAPICFFACLVFLLVLPSDRDAPMERWFIEPWRMYTYLGVMALMVLTMILATLIGIHWVLRHRQGP